jgi:hemerythrin-like domain-containing protein
MKTINQTSNSSRRKFIETSIKVAIGVGITGVGFASACNQLNVEQNISPPEDLMQEHGLLNRILLIYDTCKIQLINKQSFQNDALLNSAQIIRSFVEDYHEKQEEDYLFPRFEKANQLTDLVQVLRKQHKVGRSITDQIMQLSKAKTLTDNENQKLIQLLTGFNNMYRPHEAREDTVLFPAFRKIVSTNEYDSIGEEFEDNEYRLFGKDGFKTMVEKVTGIEMQLGIYKLAQFTPIV